MPKPTAEVNIDEAITDDAFSSVVDDGNESPTEDNSGESNTAIEQANTDDPLSHTAEITELPKFSDFLKRGDESNDTPPKEDEEEETDKDLEDQTDEEVEEEKTDEDEDKTTVEENKEKTQQPVKRTKPDLDPNNQRDYSLFAEADIPLLKKLPNQVFDSVKARLQKAKELEEQLESQPDAKFKLPPNYLSNPNAYVLSPEYGVIQQKAQLAGSIATHWEDQLINIRVNGKFQPLLKDAEGNLVPGEEKEADINDEKRINQTAIAARKQADKFERDHESFVSNFKQAHEQEVTRIKQAEEQFFPDYDKKDHPTRKMQDEIKKQLPAAYKDSPLASIVCKLGANNALLAAEIKSLRAKLSGKVNVQKTTNGAPPTKQKLGAVGGTKPGVVGTKFSDFENRRKQED
jgi:hypothetical protein